MTDNEKILTLLETLVTEIKGTNARVDKLEAKFDARFDGVDARFDGVDARLDAMDARMDNIEKQAARNLNFIVEEFERSDRRILSYLEEMALNEDGAKAKASLGIV